MIFQVMQKLLIEFECHQFEELDLVWFGLIHYSAFSAAKAM